MLTFCNLVSSTACWETPKNRVLKLLSLYDLFPSPLRLVLPCVLWFYSDVFSGTLFIYCVMVRGLLSTLQVLSYSLDSLSVHEPFLSPTLSSFHSSPSLLPSPISPSLPLPPGYNCLSQCGLKLMIPPATEIDICPANTVFFLWVFFFLSDSSLFGCRWPFDLRHAESLQLSFGLPLGTTESGSWFTAHVAGII